MASILKAEQLATQEDSKRLNGRWTREEHQRFVEAIKIHGKNWKKVEEFVGTRTGAQIRSHAQKFFLRLEKELKGKQGEKENSGKATSVRKLSDGSISTYHTQIDNFSDSEDLLKQNLPEHETSEISREASSKVLTNTKSETIGMEIHKPVNPIQFEEISFDSVPRSQHLLSKLQKNSAAKAFQSFHSPQRKSDTKTSVVNTNDTTTVNTETTNYKSPIVGELHPQHSVYIDMMNYFSKFKKTTTSLKISDFVELSSEQSTSEDENYEQPTGGKRVKKL